MNFLFLHTPFKFFVQNLWRDEAFSYLLANRSIIDIIVLSAKDFTPPLYYLLLHAWMALFGSSEISMRSISVLFFVGTAYYVYDILTEICSVDKKKAFFYLLLVFFNPLLTYYAFEARAYAMVAFFATASMYAFFVKKKRLYLIMTTLGLYTHYFMAFVLLAQGLFTLIKYRDIKRDILNIFTDIKQIILPFLLWIPWLIYMISQRSADTQSFWISVPEKIDIWYMFSVLYSGYEKTFGWDVIKSTSGYTTLIINMTLFINVFLIIGSAYVLLKTKKSKLIASYFALWGLLPSVIVFSMSFFFTPLYIPRYLIIAVPGLIIYIIYLLESLPSRTRYITLAVLFILTFQYQQFSVKYRGKTNIKKMYTEIKEITHPEDVIYVRDVLDFHLAQYYFDENKVYIYGERYDRIPGYVGKVLIPESVIRTDYPIHPKKAVVVQGDKYYIRSQY